VRYKRKKNPSYTPRLKHERYCKKCGLSGIRKGRFYHPECSPLNVVKGIVRVCPDCGQSKKVFPSAGKMQIRCKRCNHKRRRAENNSNWKGGITPENQRFRASEEYKEWRKAVFERDGYNCVLCGQHGFTLHAHHIKPFSTHPELRVDVDNGQTLCKKCHEKTDTFLSKAKQKPKRFRQLAMGFLD
jgi:HNH endonuclease